VTLQVLQSAGARCARGAPQEILKACPPARFCKLPGGEVCIYGIADAPRMTQFTAADWRAVAVATKVPGWCVVARATSRPPAARLHPVAAMGSGIGLVAIGVAIGWLLHRSR
jgi:hypothetical protein